MTYDELAQLVASRARFAVYDTVVGRAFLRAIGCEIEEPLGGRTIVPAEDVRPLMEQRYGVRM